MPYCTKLLMMMVVMMDAGVVTGVQWGVRLKRGPSVNSTVAMEGHNHQGQIRLTLAYLTFQIHKNEGHVNGNRRLLVLRGNLTQFETFVVIWLGRERDGSAVLASNFHPVSTCWPQERCDPQGLTLNISIRHPYRLYCLEVYKWLKDLKNGHVRSF